MIVPRLARREEPHKADEPRAINVVGSVGAHGLTKAKPHQCKVVQVAQVAHLALGEL